MLAGMVPGALTGCGGERADAGLQNGPGAAEPDGRQFGQVGLAATIWTVRDIDLSIARAFAPYSGEGTDTNTALAPGVTELLRANGLAVVEVPVDRLEALREGLPDAGRQQRQWIDARAGVVPAWSEVVLGPRVSVPIIETDAGVLELEPGRLRLLARAWSAGGLDDAERAMEPRIRVELVMQHLLDRRERLSDLDRDVGAGPRRPVDDGVVFDRLLIDATLDGETALVLVPVSPDEQWSEMLADTSDFTDPGAGGVDGGAGGGELVGPAAPIYPTLGEATLGGWAYARSPRPTRAVLVLEPAPPARFGLLRR